MSQDSPSPPPAPDPTATANAQSGANIATAIANARLNRVNQQTPWGSITYTQGPADANGVPTWSSQIQLSPQQQALLDQQQGMQLQRNQIAQGYLGQVGRTLDFSHLHPIDMRGQQYTGAVNAPGNAASLPATSSSSNSSAFNNDLINQLLAALGGSGPGSSNGGSNPLTPPPNPAGSTTTPAGSTPGPSANNKALVSPTYQDYLAANPQNNGGSEGGQGTFTGLSEAQWNALSDAQKWQQVGSGLAIAPGDPRYADLAKAAGVTDGGVIRTGLESQSHPINSTFYVDPKSVAQGGGVFATGNHNLTPYSELAPGVPDWFWPVMFAAGVAGGAAGSSAGVFSGAAPSVGEAGATGFTGYGSIAGSGIGEAAAGAGAGAGASLDPGMASASNYDAGLNGVGSNVGTGDALGSAPGYGAQVVDHSVNASNPSVWQQMWNNFTNGKGLLGLSPGQRAAVGLLPTLLRAASQRNNAGSGK